MNYGLLGGGGLPPGLAGYVMGEQMANQRGMNHLGMVGGIMGLQNQMRQQAMAEQTNPLQLRLMEAQVRSAENPMPVRQDMGGYIALLDPRTGTEIAKLPKTATPDTLAKQEGEDRRHSQPSGSSVLSNQTEMFKWNNISPFQQANLGIDLARLGNQGIDTWWNTGRGFTAPVPFGGSQPSAPPGGWKIPPAVQAQRDREAANISGNLTPSGTGPAIPTPAVVAGSTAGLTPKATAAVAEDAAKKSAEMEAKRNYNMTGLNETINAAEAILKNGNPTQSMTGAGIDWLGTVIGKTPRGAPQADQLRAIAGALISKMPRMEGPQSDRDVEMYRQMAGQVGDATLPTQRRLAALQTVKELWAKYERQGGASGSWGGEDRRATPSGFKVLGAE